MIQDLGAPEGHVYQQEVIQMLCILAASPWTSPSSNLKEGLSSTSQQLVSYCWNVVFERRGLSDELRASMCTNLLIPALKFSSPSIKQEFYSNKILQIIATIGRPSLMGASKQSTWNQEMNKTENCSLWFMDTIMRLCWLV